MTILTLTSTAQTTVIWKGGTPGKTQDWNCAKNWNTNKVPGVFDHVIIPNVSPQARPFPVVKDEVEPILSLTVHSNAEITIQTAGILIVEGDMKKDCQIVGKIQNNGTCLFNVYKDTDTLIVTKNSDKEQ